MDASLWLTYCSVRSSRLIHIVANGDIYFHGMTFHCVCSPYQCNPKQTEKKKLNFVRGVSEAKEGRGPIVQRKGKVGILGSRRKGKMQGRRGAFPAMLWRR